MLLEIGDISVDYGRTHALRSINMAVDQGEVVAIIGPNGAGKSTLIRAVAGLVPLSGGVIRLDGAPINRLRPPARLAAGIAHVPEGRMILTSMTIEENLLVGAHLRQDRELKRDIDELYQRFPNLAARRHLLARVLSGGEQQMLAIARALVSRPRLLLLDEPSLGLSPLFVQQVTKLAAELNSGGLTMLLVEQNVSSALKLASSVFVLSLGSVVASGSPSELKRNDLIDSYLGGTFRTAKAS